MCIYLFAHRWPQNLQVTKCKVSCLMLIILKLHKQCLYFCIDEVHNISGSRWCPHACQVRRHVGSSGGLSVRVAVAFASSGIGRIEGKHIGSHTCVFCMLDVTFTFTRPDICGGTSYPDLWFRNTPHNNWVFSLSENLKFSQKCSIFNFCTVRITFDS